MTQRKSSKVMVLPLVCRSRIIWKTASFRLSRPSSWRIFWIYCGSMLPVPSSSKRSKVDFSSSRSWAESFSRAGMMTGWDLLGVLVRIQIQLVITTVRTRADLLLVRVKYAIRVRQDMRGWISLIIFFLLKGISANIQHLRLEIDIEEILGGDEICSSTRELQGDILLCGFLFGQGLDLVRHLLVQAQQLLQFALFPSEFFLEVAIAACLQPHGGFVIDFEIINEVIVRCLQTGLLFGVILVSLLLPLDHLRPELIDLGLQLALSLRGSFQSFDEILDLFLLDCDIILQSFIFSLDHAILGVQGIGPSGQVLRGPAELIAQLCDLLFQGGFLDIGLSLGLAEIVGCSSEVFPVALLVLAECQFLVGEFLFQGLDQFLQRDAFALVVCLLGSDYFLQVLDVLLTIGQAII